MRTFRTSTAGIGLAALGALGLSALSTPASAQQIFWHQIAGHTVANPITSASVFAQQAIANAQAGLNGGNLVIPGGLTYVTASFPRPLGPGFAIVDFELPNGFNLVGCVTASTDFGGFSNVNSVTCYPTTAAAIAANAISASQAQTTGGVIQVQVALNSTPTATTEVGSIQLGTITVAGSSPGLAVLNPPGLSTAAAGKGILNCNPNAPGYVHTNCDIFGLIVESSVTQVAAAGPSLSTTLAESAQAKGVTTFPPSYSGFTSICVDMLYPYAPGEEFKQNCWGSTSQDTSVADKGVIAIDFLGLEAQVEDVDDTKVFEQTQNTATIVVKGFCGGLQLENIGSVPASCGIQPFTGENAWLIPISGTVPTQVVLGTSAIVPSPYNAGSPQCPAPTTTSAGGKGAGSPPSTSGAVEGIATGPGEVTFFQVPEPTVPSTGPLPVTDYVLYYELCDYSTEQAVISDVSHWTVRAEFECAGTPLPDCTRIAESGPDKLLPIQYLGHPFYVDFTNGSFNELAFLRIVNRMRNVSLADIQGGSSNPNYTCVQDSSVTGSGSGRFVTSGTPGNNYDAKGGAPNGGTEIVPGLSSSTSGLLDSDLTCQPVAQVVCKVTSDDGWNGYASLFTNGGGFGNQLFSNGPGVLSGTNVFYPIFQIFQLAGIPEFADPYNPNNLGSMICYAPDGVSLSQVQIDTQGVSVVNVQ